MIGSPLVKWLGLFSLSLSGCDFYQAMLPENGRFYFNNETSENMIFLINFEPIIIPPNTIESILLQPGMHTMTTSDQRVVQFMIYPGNKGGILNPTKQLYYAYSFVHGTDGIPSVYHLTEQDISVNEYQLSGKIHSSNAFVIDNNIFDCDFGIGDKVPAVLVSHTAVSQVKTKCFSHQELLNSIVAGDDLISQLSVRKVLINQIESVTLKFDYPVTEPDFNDKNLQIYAQDIMALIDDFRSASDANQKQSFYNQYHDKISNMARIYSQMGSEGAYLIEKQKYVLFMSQTRAIFSAGTLITN